MSAVPGLRLTPGAVITRCGAGGTAPPAPPSHRLPGRGREPAWSGGAGTPNPCGSPNLVQRRGTRQQGGTLRQREPRAGARGPSRSPSRRWGEAQWKKGAPRSKVDTFRHRTPSPGVFVGDRAGRSDTIGDLDLADGTRVVGPGWLAGPSRVVPDMNVDADDDLTAPILDRAAVEELRRAPRHARPAPPAAPPAEPPASGMWLVLVVLGLLVVLTMLVLVVLWS